MNTQILSTNLLHQPIAVVRFSPVELSTMGFEFMGNSWGNSNLPYSKLETQIGTLCVVANHEVWLVRGNRDFVLNRITSTLGLNQFISYLS